ncbi:MAG: hypothetical protein Rhob2KO_13760 [Rhodopirellula baltica]
MFARVVSYFTRKQKKGGAVSVKAILAPAIGVGPSGLRAEFDWMVCINPYLLDRRFAACPLASS